MIWLNKSTMAQKLTLLVILSASGMQLAGCDNCTSSSSPLAVSLITLNGQCILASNITCRCSGGGVLSTCSQGTQTFSQGTAAPGVFLPCPNTFSCSSRTTSCGSNG
ncbi:hypothetical protein Ldro_2728 [Legionella drozanskii LLAP-1]|uniref:Secreted protein n=1 Tax=Legionella drozanskii LLAP-1 TaxID=1212489 RepID=A0A0W0SMP9_9GAMM|nr:hypothetical protein Ldro_2728 [Legionella drozanskii LLAP-1]PJE18357.1 MAG: hypothetical protein CK430_00415 [Legionella sp.]